MRNGSALAWENQAANFRMSWSTTRRRVGGVVLVAQVGCHEGGFPWPDRDEAKNLITPILTGLLARIRHHLDTPEPELG